MAPRLHPADNRQPGKTGTLRTFAGSSHRMPTIYFDILSDADRIIDDEGVELPDTCVARQMALELLGQAILDGSRRGTPGVTKVELRDQNGPFLRVSAAVVIEKL
ncbi:DUF6894 family protein [Bradyrhizobium liaoningense]|uniref:DUF6894 family protein n=1 Tax=Bradyrhizobium liaoningense TaxID=43992 RepID=UPI001BAAB8D8|nr:hypothetical protein [Bradyrhizobium liaoningense]MBR0822986.1 hypothetical protein [Bradyrhizobium liaoningense]